MSTAAGQLYFEGTLAQLEDVEDRITADQWTLHLSTDSVAFTPSDTYPASYPEPADSGYAPLLVSDLFTSNTGGSSGNATLSIQGAVWGFTGSDSPAETAYQWWIDAPGRGALIAFGAVSPPYTIPTPGGVFALDPITLTLGTCTPAGVSSPLVLLDLFGAADGTTLPSHSPLIGSATYGAVLNGLVITGQSVSGNTVGADNIVSFSQPNATHTVRAKSRITLSGPVVTSSCGPMGGGTDSATLWLAELGGGGTANVVLYRVAGATFTAADSVAFTPTGTGDYDVFLTVSGDTITFGVGGEVSATFSTSSSSIGTWCGLHVFSTLPQIGSLVVTTP